MPIVVRKSEDRGHADHGWLNSYHTFSFASYFDRKFQGFHDLLVINEDRVAPGKGFGTHPHNEMEIFSYVLSGALEHKDSMGNIETIGRGDVQFTSAGTGIRHSEYNSSKTEWVHFLQIWVVPNVNHISPSYQTKRFEESEKYGQLRLIISPDASEGSISIHQDVKMFASILRKGEQVSYTFPKGHAGYIHLADTNGAISINDSVVLKSGDGAFIEETVIQIVGQAEQSEFVLFDLK